MIPEIYHCQICGYQADNRHISCILTHLQDKHGITRGTRVLGASKQFMRYLNKYFINPLCACGCGARVNLNKRKMRYNLFAPQCYNRARFTNPTRPEFHIFNGLNGQDAINTIKQLQSKAALSIKPSMRNRLNALNCGSGNPSSTISVAAREDTDIISAKVLIKEQRGKSNGFKGKHHTPETLAQLAILRSQQSKTVTKPELIMFGVLLGAGIEFLYQVPIGKYIADYTVGNTIIEVFGDYWHSDKFLNGSKKQQDNDKVAYLRSIGYDVIVVYESALINKLLPSTIVEFLNENTQHKTD